MNNWTAATIPSQSGKLAIVTGPTSGAGIYIALELARAGAQIILAARNAQKASVIAKRIQVEVPQANVSSMDLDLSSLASVGRFAQSFSNEHRALDLLINNAGVAAVPYQRTIDGFELQFGTNHLGHFALTGLLLPFLLVNPAARVVTIASGASSTGQINFDDLQSERHYNRYGAYAQSKLANMLFAFEFQHRLDATDLTLKSLAAQPGWTATNLGPGKNAHFIERNAWAILNRLFAHSPEQGALPSLYAATGPDLAGGSYISPSRFRGLHGPPAVMDSGKAAQNRNAAERLWAVSEELTGVHYAFTTAKASS